MDDCTVHMARNEEKAQSMLYRFREAQAAELGLGTRADRRPKMASGCKSLRECERWRGDILREISRKVSKIQDAGLTDYEVRDLNDDINKLIREKRHWENQIVALGGANYRRNVAMLDDDGKEVPGTKGYKYFGRAKDLPGVRELFQSRKKEEDEENLVFTFYKKFTNQGPGYYGDLDENDGSLLKYEREAENEAWEEAYNNVLGALNLPTNCVIPKLSRTPSQPLSTSSRSTSSETTPPETNSVASVPDVALNGLTSSTATDGQTLTKAEAQAYAHAHAAATFIPFLRPEDLVPPKMPTRDEISQVLLALRKKALVDEYFGDSGGPG